MEQTSPQEGIGQLLLAVARDDYNRPVPGLEVLAGFDDVKTHLVELVQQVVGKLQIGLIDLVYEQHDLLLGGERFSQLSQSDVLLDVGYVPVMESRIVQALDGVIDIEPFAGFGSRFDVPRDQPQTDVFRDDAREPRFASPRLSFQQERPL